MLTKSRSSHRKSRKGCMTCRVRRIKCDEGLPSCKNCSSTGRRCDGPREERFLFVDTSGRGRLTDLNAGSTPLQEDAHRPVCACSRLHTLSDEKFKHDILKPVWTYNLGLKSGNEFCQLPKGVSGGGGHVPTLSLPLAPVGPSRGAHELRAFHFFLSRTAPILSGTLENEFWTQLVPQLCLTDPGIWDAVLAISILWEHPPSAGLPPNESAESAVHNLYHRQALRWYYRSLTQLRQRIHEGAETTSVSIVSCLLFTSIEYQQGNVSNAVRLVNNAYKLAVGAPRSLTHMKHYRAEKSEFDRIIADFLQRHAVILETFVCGLPPEWSDNAYKYLNQHSIPRLSSFTEARLQLCTLMYRAYEVIRTTSLFMLDPDVFAQHRPYQRRILQLLHHWHEEFQALLESDVGLEAMQKEWAASHLLLYYRVTYVSLSVCFDSQQTDFDLYDQDFKLILMHAATVLELSQQDTHTKPYLFSTGLLPPLYFVVWRCRHPAIRRQALDLMRKSEEDEHNLVGVPPAEMAGRIIAVEEGQENSTAIMSSQDQSVLRPSASNRICHVIFEDGCGVRRSKLRYWKMIVQDDVANKVKEFVLEI